MSSTQNTSESSELFDYQKDLLAKEIAYIEDQVSRFDELSFKIKGWAITIFSALVAVALKERSGAILIASVPSALVFWGLDALFHRYQKQIRGRMLCIEQFVNSTGIFRDNGMRQAFEKQDMGEFPLHDPASKLTVEVYESVRDDIKRRKSYLGAALKANVVGLYGPMIAVALVVWLFW